MILSFYQHLPLYIDPIAFTIGSFSVRWYALSYLAAFAVTYGLLRWRVNFESNYIAQIFNFQFSISNKISNLLLDFLLVAFLCALIGGRLGYFIFYDFSYFYSNPLTIIFPFDENGQFTGFYGMSYHGALLGIFLGSWVFLKIKKIDFWAWADFVAPAAAAGYFFGRIGNFFNGELYGRVTTSQLGMYFVSDPINLRYPSQLLEAFFEGLILFLILWNLRNWKLEKGKIFALYLVGYGVFRVISEQFRQPDPQLGFILAKITLGQLLSVVMIIMGTFLFFRLRCIRREKLFDCIPKK